MGPALQGKVCMYVHKVQCSYISHVNMLYLFVYNTHLESTFLLMMFSFSGIAEKIKELVCIV